MTEQKQYDIAIIGCGPAGLSAAVNAGIRRKPAVLFGGELCAPKLHRSPLISNYLGLPDIPGRELREKFLGHIRQFNIPVHQVKVDSVQRDGEVFAVLAGSDVFLARTVILATGVTVLKMLEGEREFIGRGVGYCATCDGPLYKGKNVAVLAHTREGVEDANFLAGFCRKVYFIPGKGLDASQLDPGIEVISDDEPQAVLGDGVVSGLKLGGRTLDVDGVFIYRETHLPDQLLPGLEAEDNHIKVNRDCSTSIEGVFAAGDCTGKPYGLSKAVGEGQVAGLNAAGYLDKLH